MRMKAGYLVEPEHYDMIKASLPELEQGQVLVRVARAAICGSDLHFFHNRPPRKYPCTPGFSGHEAVGTVECSTVEEWKAGDRVLIIFPTASANSAFAEYASVASRQLVPLPNGTPFDQLVVAQQLGTVLYAWSKMSNVVDRVVAVLGQGPAGLMFTSLARSAGARSVIGIDVISHRLAVASQMGADATIDASEVDPAKALADLTGGEMADVAIEAVGEAETIDSLSRLIHVGGELLFFGIPPVGKISIDFADFFRRYARTLTVADTHKEPGFRCFRLAIDMIRRGTFDVRPLVTHVLALDAIQEGFLLADSKADGAVKVILDPTS